MAFNEVADKMQTQLELGQVRFPFLMFPYPHSHVVDVGVLHISRAFETRQ